MVIVGRLHPGVVKICRPLIVEDQILKLCARKFSEALPESLRVEDAHRSSLKCVETHVVDFPDGSEKGTAIGIDFSGRIFRLVRVLFRGGRKYLVSSRLYEIPDTTLRGGGFKVVGYVARCVADFVETNDVKDGKIILGVSIGFLIRQESLQHAELVRWNENFHCEDFIKEDFFTQLKLALKKHKSTKNMYLISVTGDAASCLLTALYKDPWARIGLVIDGLQIPGILVSEEVIGLDDHSTSITMFRDPQWKVIHIKRVEKLQKSLALIVQVLEITSYLLGEQINICYLEKQENITLFPGDGLRTRTAVNVDFRCFGDDGCLDFIKTEFDQRIDAESKDPERFTLDKLISGRYLGEIFRLCLIKLVEEKLVLQGVLKSKLNTPGVIKTEDLAAMEMEDEKESARCKIILRRFGYVDPSEEDCCQIRFAARCILKRSAHLLAAFLSALIGHLQIKEPSVYTDGMLLRRFPGYLTYLRKKVDKIKRPEVRYKMALNDKDDIALGAGLLAFIYKDSVIKVEEKYRILPPMRPVNVDRGFPCNDCEIFPETPGTVTEQFCQ